MKKFENESMKSKNEKLNTRLPEIEKQIKETFGEKVMQIILFGSYARGDYDSESDVDILVVVDDDDLSGYKKKRSELVEHYLDTEGILLSILIERYSITKKYKDHSPFLIDLIKEGTVVYGKTNH